MKLTSASSIFSNEFRNYLITDTGRQLLDYINASPTLLEDLRVASIRYPGLQITVGSQYSGTRFEPPDLVSNPDRPSAAKIVFDQNELFIRENMILGRPALVVAEWPDPKTIAVRLVHELAHGTNPIWNVDLQQFATPEEYSLARSISEGRSYYRELLAIDEWQRAGLSTPAPTAAGFNASGITLANLYQRFNAVQAAPEAERPALVDKLFSSISSNLPTSTPNGRESNYRASEYRDYVAHMMGIDYGS